MYLLMPEGKPPPPPPLPLPLLFLQTWKQVSWRQNTFTQYKMTSRKNVVKHAAAQVEGRSSRLINSDGKTEPRTTSRLLLLGSEVVAGEQLDDWLIYLIPKDRKPKSTRVKKKN